MEINIKELQKQILELFKDIHAICEQNDITYYMLGGTLLGAIRHKGFIPWDDDLDIGMPRKDYEKFLNLSQSVMPDYMFIKQPNNSETFILPFAKAMDKRTTLVEHVSIDVVGGVFVDIFPLDGVGNSWKLARLRCKYYKFKNRMLYSNQNPITKSNPVKRLFQTFSNFFTSKSIVNSMIRTATSNKYEESSIVANYSGNWGFKEFMEKDIFGEGKLYEFEGGFYYGPNDYDSYLKSLYGDYMKLPSVDKQKSHHNMVYMNLELPYEEYKGEQA